MAHLYINSRGYKVTRHSYSASDDFHFCPTKYHLKRVQGWNEREQRASTRFGEAIESAVQSYFEKNTDEGRIGVTTTLSTFEKNWRQHQNNTELIYTATECDWESLLKSGRELLQLFLVRFTNGTIPILKSIPPRFQVQYMKEVFPNSDLSGIEFTAYIDMLASYAVSEGVVEKVVIDIKTSGVALDNTPGMLALDPQLRAYAWITGIPDVGFLWFQKVNREIKAGSRVTVLEGSEAGKELLVGKVNDEALYKTLSLVSESQYAEMPRGQKKADIEARVNFLAKEGYTTTEEYITKQRIQFVTARVSPEQQEEIAKQIGHDIQAIHAADQENYWPKTGGVRYPNSKCPSCAMRGICLNNNALRDQFLIHKDVEFNADAF